MAFRIFDPDTSVLDWQPKDLSFPLYVHLDTLALDEGTRHNVFQTTPEGMDEMPDKYCVMVTRFDDTQLPIMVQLFNEFQDRPDIWVPWNACSPELTLLPN